MNPNCFARGMLAAAAASFLACAADAAIVVWNVNQVIPATPDGLAMNVETGQTDTGSFNTDLPGMDLNLRGTTALNFFWAPTYAGASAGVSLTNSVTGAPGTSCSNLAVGFIVGSSLVGGTSGAAFITPSNASFTTGGGGRWSYDAINYFGFRFTNAAGAIRYGWASVQVGATAATRTLLQVAYEDTGGSIPVGYPIPAPGAAALLGVAGLAGGRRRRA